MRRVIGIALLLILAVGVLALLAPATEAGGPKVCPLIECGTCAQLQKVPGQKCPVCVAIPGCIP